MTDDTSLPSSSFSSRVGGADAVLTPLSDSEARALGHPGGISSWPDVLDYGNGLERDTAYTAAFLASIATSAATEGWLDAALAAGRAELFGATAAAATSSPPPPPPLSAPPSRCAWVSANTALSASSAGAAASTAAPEERGGAGLMGDDLSRTLATPTSRSALGTAVSSPGTWLTSLEYDLACGLLRLAATASVSSAHAFFFDVLLPRADDIGARVWADTWTGVSANGAAEAQRHDRLEPLDEQPLLPWRTSALTQDSDDTADEERSVRHLDVSGTLWRRLSGGINGISPLVTPEVMAASSWALARGYPLCSVRACDTGIAALRPAASAVSQGTGTGNAPHATTTGALSSNSNLGAASSGMGHHHGADALAASLLRDGHSRGGFGPDSDVEQLLGWKAALEGAIDTMRVEAVRRQAAAVMEEL